MEGAAQLRRDGQLERGERLLHESDETAAEKKLLPADEFIRLPSEAEWEYACRAGSKTAWSFGDKASNISDYAWHKDNSKGEDPPVGRKKPNAWGLYDMHGYVSEWCADAWHANYKGAPTDGRVWTDADEKDRVIRGGSFADPADSHRSAFRDHKPIATAQRPHWFPLRQGHRARRGQGGSRMTRFMMLFMILALALATLAGDWPQLLGPQRDGKTAEKDLIDTWPKEGPPVVWERTVGDGYASPVVADGRLVLFHRVDDDDVVECLSARTGKEHWKYRYRTDYVDGLGKGNGPRSTPVISGGKVYTLGAAGALLCLDLKSGEKVWQKDLLHLYEVKRSFFGVGTTPLVEGDLLLVNVGGDGAGIVAFHKDNGKEVWKATDQGASYSSPVAATVDGVRRVFFFTREGVVMLDPVAGKVRFFRRWRSRMDASVNAAMPVLPDSDHIFLSSSYDTGDILLKIKKDDLEEVWQSQKALSSHFSTPVAVGDHLFGFTGRQEVGAELRCLDWKTGKVCWTGPEFGCGSIIAAGTKLFVLSESGELVLVEANGERYREKARASVLRRPCRARPRPGQRPAVRS